MSIQVKNIKSTSLRPDVSNPIFKDIRPKLEKMIPELNREEFSFDIFGINSRIANAIIRIIKDELPTLALDVPFTNVETDDPFIIPDELTSRIGLIPIRQDTPETYTFSIFVKPSIDGTYVSSKDMKLKNNQDQEIYFSSTYRIAHLNQGRKLKVDDITIKQGQGITNAKYSPCGLITQYMLEYIRVTYMKNEIHWIDRVVKIDDIIKYIKVKSVHEILGKPILIIPDEQILTRLSSDFKKRLDEYQIIIKNGTDKHLQNLEFYQSTMYHPSAYNIRIQTKGTISGRPLMRSCCDYVIKRLNRVQDSIGQEDGATEIESQGEVLKVTIFEESYSIGELINYTLYFIDPSIPKCAVYQPHPLIRNIVMTIKHPEGMKLLVQAIIKSISQFETIRKFFED